MDIFKKKNCKKKKKKNQKEFTDEQVINRKGGILFVKWK